MSRDTSSSYRNLRHQLGAPRADGSRIRDQEIEAVRELYGHRSGAVTRYDSDGLRGTEGSESPETPGSRINRSEGAPDPSGGES